MKLKFRFLFRGQLVIFRPRAGAAPLKQTSWRK